MTTKKINKQYGTAKEKIACQTHEWLITHDMESPGYLRQSNLFLAYTYHLLFCENPRQCIK